MTVLRSVSLLYFFALLVTTCKCIDAVLADNDDYVYQTRYYYDIPEDDRAGAGDNYVVEGDDDFLRGKPKSAEVYDYYTYQQKSDRKRKPSVPSETVAGDNDRDEGGHRRKSNRRPARVETVDYKDIDVANDRLVDRVPPPPEETRLPAPEDENNVEKKEHRHRHRHRKHDESKKHQEVEELPPPDDFVAIPETDVAMPPVDNVPTEERPRKHRHRQPGQEGRRLKRKKVKSPRPEQIEEQPPTEEPSEKQDERKRQIESEERRAAREERRRQRAHRKVVPEEEPATTPEPEEPALTPRPSRKPRIRPQVATTTLEPVPTTRAAYGEDEVPAPSSAELRKQLAKERAERGERLGDDSMELLLLPDEHASAEIKTVSKFHEEIHPKKTPSEVEEEERRRFEEEETLRQEKELKERRRQEAEQREKLRREQEERDRRLEQERLERERQNREMEQRREKERLAQQERRKQQEQQQKPADSVVNNKLFEMVGDFIAKQHDNKKPESNVVVKSKSELETETTPHPRRHEESKLYKVVPVYVGADHRVHELAGEEEVIEDSGEMFNEEDETDRQSTVVAAAVQDNGKQKPAQERLEDVKVYLNKDKKGDAKAPVEVVVERPSRQEFIQQKKNERLHQQQETVDANKNKKPDVEIVRPLPGKGESPIAPLVVVVDTNQQQAKQQSSQQVAANEQGAVTINVAPASGSDKLARPPSMAAPTDSGRPLRSAGSRWVRRQIPSGLPVTSDPKVYCKAVFAASPEVPPRYLFADPTTCTAFFYCKYGSTVADTSGTRTVCPSGQRFSTSMLTCVPAWNPNDICAADPCEDQTSTATAQTCWADSTNCRKFYSCSSGWSVPRCCPAGTSPSPTNRCTCEASKQCTTSCSEAGENKQTTVSPIMNANNTCFDSAMTQLRPEGATGFQSYDPFTGKWASFVCPAGTNFDMKACSCAGNAPVVSSSPYRQCTLYLPFNDDFEDFSISQMWTQPYGTVSISKSVASSGTGSALFNGGRVEIEGFNNKELGNTVSWCLMYRCSPNVNDPSKTSCSSMQGTLMSNGVSTNQDYSLMMQLTGNSRTVDVQTAPFGQMLTATSTQPLSSDAWHQLCTIYDGRQLQMFEDGKLIQSVPGAVGKKNVKTIQAPYNIGASRPTNGAFSGYIDEVLVCQTLLSAEEMTAHRTGDRAALVRAGLISNCPARRPNC